MSCDDCRISLSGIDRRDGLAALFQVAQNEAVVLPQVERGVEIHADHSFAIVQSATVKQISAEIVAEAWDFVSSAKIEILLYVDAETTVTIFRDAPLRLRFSRILSNLNMAFAQHAVHPRLIHMMIGLRCYKQSEPVLHIQKSELHPNMMLLVKNLPVSAEAKTLVPQLKCWFPSPFADRVLAKHLLAGLLLTHLFDDIKIFMQTYPEYCLDFSWSFLTNYTILKIERILYCKQSVWLFSDPEMTLMVNDQGICHSHRLKASIVGVNGVSFDVSMKPTLIPLSLAFRIKRPHLIRNNAFEIDGNNYREICSSLERRKVSFNRRVFTASAVLIGKARLVRKKLLRRLHNKYMPGSAAFQEARSHFQVVPARKWSLLLYLGYEDFWRARKQHYRRMKIRLLVSSRVRP